jgi:hypothetical protein
LATLTGSTPLSIQPADSATPQVLTSIAGNYTNLYAYDGCDANDPWKNYDPSAPPFANDLTEINASIGLWINMTITDTLEVTGSKVTSASIPLCEDWNLVGVGYPSLQTQPITEALASIEGHYRTSGATGRRRAWWGSTRTQERTSCINRAISPLA